MHGNFLIEEVNVTNSELKSKIKQEYVKLNEMIRQTSEILAGLVKTQGSALKLQYTRKEMYLCLVRQDDNKGRCSGVRWAKYQYSFKNGRRSWYNFKLPGKVPPSTVRLMSPEEQYKFAEMDAIAVRISSLRHDLTSKKNELYQHFRTLKRLMSPGCKKSLRTMALCKRTGAWCSRVQEVEPLENTQETEMEESYFQRYFAQDVGLSQQRVQRNIWKTDNPLFTLDVRPKNFLKFTRKRGVVSKEKRALKISEWWNLGSSQKQIAEGVGLSRLRGAQIVLKKCTQVQKTNTLTERAKKK